MQRAFVSEPISEEPLAPPTLDPQELQDDLFEALESSFAEEPKVFLATDGSSRDNVAAFAVNVPSRDLLLACGVQGEDQSPFKSELCALEAVSQVLFRLAQKGVRGSVVILCDCESAILACHFRWWWCLPLAGIRDWRPL